MTSHLFWPEFFEVFFNSFRLLGTSSTLKSLGFSILRLLISLAISSFLGLLLGLIAGILNPFGQFLMPMISVLKSFPTIALILLLAVYVPHFSYYVVSLVLFPIIFQASYEGARKKYLEFHDDLSVNGSSFLTTSFRVVLPTSLPHFFLGLLQALGLGIKVEITAEIFAYRSDYYGLGKLIYLSSTDLDYLSMMSYVILALEISLIFDLLLLLAKKKTEGKLGLEGRPPSF